MGMLLKALLPMSSYAAKGGATRSGNLWAELKDRVDGALFPAQLDEFEAWLDARPLDYPAAYREPLNDLIEQKRGELAAESVTEILKDKFDF